MSEVIYVVISGQPTGVLLSRDNYSIVSNTAVPITRKAFFLKSHVISIIILLKILCKEL